MEQLKEIADSVRGSLIPRLHILRRVPTRYRKTLPLHVMQQYQCIVVGAANGILTVAITDPQDTSVIETIRTLTGRTIFPVWVDPVRMRLLLRRIERYERYKSMFGRYYRSQIAQLHTIVKCLVYLSAQDAQKEL